MRGRGTRFHSVAQRVRRVLNSQLRCLFAEAQKQELKLQLFPEMDKLDASV